MDFTIKTYNQLLASVLSQGYSFQTLANYIESCSNKSEAHKYLGDKIPSHFKLIILRHDIDKLPLNSLKFAQIQTSFKIVGTYYFRFNSQSFNEVIMKKIHELGHEIGYHYETMDANKGNIDKAYNEFCRNLEEFRKHVPIKTISMHGSPMSVFDNRSLWEKYDYRKLGIIAEPYFDIDFTKFFYLTDTGRRWDGWRVSLRDKVPEQEEWIRQGLVFHSTKDIIRAANEGRLPKQIMMTFHPQRWNDRFVPWVQEAIGQNLKNIGKKMLLRLRKDYY